MFAYQFWGLQCINLPGKYVTGDVDANYLKKLEDSRNDAAKKESKKNLDKVLKAVAG